MNVNIFSCLCRRPARRRERQHGPVAFLASIAACWASTTAGTTAQAPPLEAESNQPVVVELFLSQACTRCPPAAALLPAFADNEGVIALSWHVDYWNMTNTPNGRWTDPFSKAAYTERQKRYNANIRQRNSVYTPQIIVGGEHQTVGANEAKISGLIAASTGAPAAITATTQNNQYLFSIGESEQGGNAYLVTFKRRARTNIMSGGNAGKLFDEINVVTQMRPLGVVRRKGAALSTARPAPDEGCALIVQEPRQARIVAAAYCPRT